MAASIRPNEPEALTDELDDRFLDVITYHHRNFQQYSIEHAVCHEPIDEDEIERHIMQYDVLKKILDNRLIFPPLIDPRRILELGYGTANWAVEVAEQNPSCEVLAVDISPLMGPEEDEVPGNLYLQVDDLNRRFTFPHNHFDLVNSRLLAGGINTTRWNSYLRDIFKVTRPGGWCQMVEIYFNCQSDNGTLTQDHGLRQWSTRYLESLEGIKDLRIPLRLPEKMRAAGFIDIEHRMLPMHTCGWSEDARENEIGVANRENVHRFLSSLAVYPFKRLGMTIADVQLLIAHARNEAEHPDFKAYFPLYICIGRKPRR